MKAETLRELSTEELNKKVVELKEELFNLRFQNATGSLEKHNLIPHLKKDIARIETEMRARKISAEVGAN